MRFLEDPQAMQKWSLEQRRAGKMVGFVPTMGALHEGHLRLVDQSISENDHTVVSIFVNPTQFDDLEDFEKYPQSLQHDQELLKQKGISVLFHPTVEGVYPTGTDMQVTESELSQLLCGAHRPGHFQGMLTVVLKLFGIVQPHRAYFGDKDFQQVLLVEKLVETFFISTKIIRVPTVRDSSGIALSSRNERLPKEKLAELAMFPIILKSAESDRDAINSLKSAGFEVDYVTTWRGQRHSAIHFQGVRFIDHVEV